MAYNPNSGGSQGASVGDRRNFDGILWRWTGGMWQIEPPHMQNGNKEWRSLFPPDQGGSNDANGVVPGTVRSGSTSPQAGLETGAGGQLLMSINDPNNPNSKPEGERSLGSAVGDRRLFNGILWRWDGSVWAQETPNKQPGGAEYVGETAADGSQLLPINDPKNPNSIGTTATERSLGSAVGDRRMFYGVMYRWNGNGWEKETAQRQPGGSDFQGEVAADGKPLEAWGDIADPSTIAGLKAAQQNWQEFANQINAKVGDRRYFGGSLYRWDGSSWKVEPANMQNAGEIGADGKPLAPITGIYGFSAESGTNTSSTPSSVAAGTSQIKEYTAGSAFNFDWEKARSDSLTQLTPYYTQKLNEAKGDVERAKRLIEEDYTMGKRISGEDYQREMKQSQEDFETSSRSDELTKKEETRDTTGALNQRGVFTSQINEPGTSKAPVSGYAQEWFMKPLEEKQNLRSLAIKRALERRQELATTQSERETEKLATARTHGIEEQDIAWPRFQRELEEEKRRRAFETVTPMKYEEEYAKWRAVNPDYINS